jgi:hypothetical protein
VGLDLIVKGSGLWMFGDYQVWEVHTTGWAKLTQERAEMVVPPYDL